MIYIVTITQPDVDATPSFAFSANSREECVQFVKNDMHNIGFDVDDEVDEAFASCDTFENDYTHGEFIYTIEESKKLGE